jgi:hypothetical protein
MNKFDFCRANWNRSEHVKYREVCLIDAYHKKYGVKRIPKDRQYWTLCGNHVLNDKVLRHAELPSLLKAKLISQSQFWGVDDSQDIIERASQLYPKANWVCDEFTQAVRTALNTDQFKPAVVHLDTTSSSQIAVDMLRKTMAYIELSGVQHCMVVVNIIYKHWIRRCTDTVDQILKKLVEDTTRHKEYWELVLRNSVERPSPDYRFVSRQSEMIAFTLFFNSQPVQN